MQRETVLAPSASDPWLKRLPGRIKQAARSRTLYRRLAWVVGALLVFWLIAYLAVPPLAKWQAQKIASEKLGRLVTIGAIEFKPWSLELTVTDLAIARQAGAAPDAGPQLAIKRVYVDAELQSLFRLAPVADAITVEEPRVFITHFEGGRYDIDDMLEKLQAAPKDEKPAGEPPKFALYNLSLSGGSIDFTDGALKPAAITHQVRGLAVAVPFLSNLASQRDILTEPRLAFKLNGSAFDTAAVGTPFAQTRKTDATLKIAALDLKPYLGYLPSSLPLRLQAAVLDADLTMNFEQAPSTVVKLSGSVTASQVRLVDTRPGAAGGAQVLAFERLLVQATDARPLQQSMKLSLVEMTAPDMRITRSRDGQLNFIPQPAIDSGADNARNTRATDPKELEKEPPAPPAAPVPSTPSTTAPAKPWQIEIERMRLARGQAHWLDETLPQPAPIVLGQLEFEATRIKLPFTVDAPAQFKGYFALDPQSLSSTPISPNAQPTKGKSKAQAREIATTAAPVNASSASTLSFSGTATDQSAQASAKAEGWPLRLGARYIGRFLAPALDGRLDAEIGVAWQAGKGGDPAAVRLTAPRLTLGDVQLAQNTVSLASIRQIALSGVDIDLNARRVKAASVQLSQPKARVERDAQKRWMYESWLAAGTRSDQPANSLAPATAGQAAAPTAPWAVSIDEIALDGGALSFIDRAGTKPVAFDLSAMNATLKSFKMPEASVNGSVNANANANVGANAKPGSAPALPLMPLSVSFAMAAGRTPPGSFDFKGGLALAPLQAQGALAFARLPVQAFEPYFGDALNIELLRADASFTGQAQYRQTPTGPFAKVTGDVALEEFRANTLAPSEELLAWKTLNLRGLAVALDPGRATQIDVRETALTDFFARVIVTPEGRINLQDLLEKPDPAAQAANDAAIKSGAARARNTRATGQNTIQNERMEADAAAGSAPVVSASAPAPAQTTQSGLAPLISFGPMSLVGGRVYFSDRFVKPNYSANLTELTGKLSAFSSRPQAAAAAGSPASVAVLSGAGAPSGAAPARAFDMADLELLGRAEGTASLEILGKLNPLADPLALDITGKVRDLELPPLSPYAVKYAGYGINRGKLSLDVKYVVRPDGQLTAGNKLVLNQLVFGDKVEGAPASLPVKLAVALLADRNGVIDLDLPISGSLSDPQFRLGPVIVKVILNVITKAITAPFSLLANAFGGGGEELGSVAFAAGSAELGSEAKTALDKVAKALTDRPALKLTVVGTSSLEAERSSYQRARLNDIVRAEKRRALVKEGGAATGEVTVSPAEYPALLKEVYQRAEFPKPRNAIGLAKDLPDADMEKLLLADIRVSEDAIRELAVQRGAAVKDYLAAAKLPPERLFLGAAKLQPPDAKWTPRAELELGS
jgi:hypothetical protein